MNINSIWASLISYTCSGKICEHIYTRFNTSSWSINMTHAWHISVEWFVTFIHSPRWFDEKKWYNLIAFDWSHPSLWFIILWLNDRNFKPNSDRTSNGRFFLLCISHVNSTSPTWKYDEYIVCRIQNLVNWKMETR